MHEISLDQKVTFYAPHPGHGGAVKPPPPSVLAEVKDLQCRTMSIRAAMKRIRQALMKDGYGNEAILESQKITDSQREGDADGYILLKLSVPFKQNLFPNMLPPGFIRLPGSATHCWLLIRFLLFEENAST